MLPYHLAVDKSGLFTSRNRRSLFLRVGWHSFPSGEASLTTLRRICFAQLLVDVLPWRCANLSVLISSRCAASCSSEREAPSLWMHTRARARTQLVAVKKLIPRDLIIFDSVASNFVAFVTSSTVTASSFRNLAFNYRFSESDLSDLSINTQIIHYCFKGLYLHGCRIRKIKEFFSNIKFYFIKKIIRVVQLAKNLNEIYESSFAVVGKHFYRSM